MAGRSRGELQQARWTVAHVERVVAWLKLPEKTAASLFGVTGPTWATWQRRGCLLDSGAFLFRIADRVRQRSPGSADHLRNMLGVKIKPNGAPLRAVTLSEDQRARAWCYLASLAYSPLELRQTDFEDGRWV